LELFMQIKSFLEKTVFDKKDPSILIKFRVHLLWFIFLRTISDV